MTTRCTSAESLRRYRMVRRFRRFTNRTETEIGLMLGISRHLVHYYLNRAKPWGLRK